MPGDSVIGLGIVAQVDIRTFGQNIYYLIGLAVVAVGVFVLALVAWVVLRALSWRAQVRQAQQDAARARLREDGQPYPPADRGLCDVCAQAFEKVYYLPSGQRMCEDCYRQMVQEAHEQAFCGPAGTPQLNGETGTDHERRKAGPDVVHPEGDGRQGL